MVWFSIRVAIRRSFVVTIGTLVLAGCSGSDSRRRPGLDVDDGGRDATTPGTGGAPSRLHQPDAQVPMDATTGHRDASVDAASDEKDASRQPNRDASSDAARTPDASPHWPVLCADVLAAEPAAPDGNYTLYIAANASRPWTAYCRNMSGTSDGAAPAEYLSLPATGANYNYSQYAVGGAATGTSVTTYFTKVRFDPRTMTIDGADLTFATSSGLLYHDGVASDALPWFPYGVAMACDNASTLGHANIDLTGTPFVLDPAYPICVKTFGPGGSSVTSADGKTASLIGEGYCGWTSANCGVDPSSIVFEHIDVDWRTVLAYGPLAGVDAH